MIKRLLQRLISVSQSHSVISSQMAVHYRETYGIQPYILYTGADPDHVCTPRPLVRDQIHFTIGHVGKIYPSYVHGWSILIEAVRILNARYRSPRFHVLHVGTLDDTLKCEEVTVTGWLDGHSFHQALTQFDLSFVHMSFTPEEKLVAATSFPTRVGSYIQAQCPLISLSPPYASITHFIEENQCGISQTELNAVDLANKIENLAFGEGVYESAQSNMVDLLSRYNHNEMFQVFEQMITTAMRKK